MPLARAALAGALLSCRVSGVCSCGLQLLAHCTALSWPLCRWPQALARPGHGPRGPIPARHSLIFLLPPVFRSLRRLDLGQKHVPGAEEEDELQALLGLLAAGAPHLRLESAEEEERRAFEAAGSGDVVR